MCFYFFLFSTCPPKTFEWVFSISDGPVAFADPAKEKNFFYVFALLGRLLLGVSGFIQLVFADFSSRSSRDLLATCNSSKKRLRE